MSTPTNTKKRARDEEVTMEGLGQSFMPPQKRRITKEKQVLAKPLVLEEIEMMLDQLGAKVAALQARIAAKSDSSDEADDIIETLDPVDSDDFWPPLCQEDICAFDFESLTGWPDSASPHSENALDLDAAYPPEYPPTEVHIAHISTRDAPTANPHPQQAKTVSDAPEQPARGQTALDEASHSLYGQWKSLLPSLTSSYARYVRQTTGRTTPIPADYTSVCDRGCDISTSTILCLSMNYVETITIEACRCRSVFELLILNGMFPASPSEPRVAVSIVLIEWYECSFDKKSGDTISSLASTMNLLYKRRGFAPFLNDKEPGEDLVHQALSNAIQWYARLKDMTGAEDAITPESPPTTATTRTGSRRSPLLRSGSSLKNSPNLQHSHHPSPNPTAMSGEPQRLDVFRTSRPPRSAEPCAVVPDDYPRPRHHDPDHTYYRPSHYHPSPDSLDPPPSIYSYHSRHHPMSSYSRSQYPTQFHERPREDFYPTYHPQTRPTTDAVRHPGSYHHTHDYESRGHNRSPNMPPRKSSHPTHSHPAHRDEYYGD